MNYQRYLRLTGDGKLIQAGEIFPILDMCTWLDYRTEHSAGFGIGSIGKTQTTRMSKGHLDVHHPCAGHTKLRIRCVLPYSLDWEQMKQAMREIMIALDIPADETYETNFACAPQGLYVIDQRVDRNGETNCVVSRKRHKTPVS